MWLHDVGRCAILSVVSGKTIELRVTVGNCLCDFIWSRYQDIPFGISTSSGGQVKDFPQRNGFKLYQHVLVSMHFMCTHTLFDCFGMLGLLTIRAARCKRLMSFPS